RFRAVPGQRTRSRPTYVTQPRELVTVTVTPPPRAAGQLSSCPWTTTVTGRPAISTRARFGVNVNSTATSDPCAATAVFFEAAIGAPQRPRQHHDETARRTCVDPVRRNAFGGPASATAARSATMGERYRGAEKNMSLAADPDV